MSLFSMNTVAGNVAATSTAARIVSERLAEVGEYGEWSKVFEGNFEV